MSHAFCKPLAAGKGFSSVVFVADVGFFAHTRGKIHTAAKGSWSYSSAVPACPKFPPFSRGDTIRVAVDCDNGVAEWWLNGEKKSTVMVPKDVPWHGIVGGSGTYRVEIED